MQNEYSFEIFIMLWNFVDKIWSRRDSDAVATRRLPLKANYKTSMS